MKKLNKLLLEAHSETAYDISNIISPGDIQKGVHCPTCGHLGMIRKNRCWLCLLCGAKSTTAHVKAIHHFFLLVKPTITVSECCEFLCLPSRHIAKRLLISMGLQTIGNTKGRFYLSPYHIKK